MKRMMNKVTGGPGEMPNQPFRGMLAETLFTERQLVDTLPKLISEAQDPELRESLSHHLEETRGHVANVERMFELFGAEPEAEESPVMRGLQEAHSTLSSKTSDGLRDMVVATAAAATEHHEIAIYEGLLTMAEAMGKREVCDLIEKNLGQERHALELATRATHELSESHTADMTR